VPAREDAPVIRVELPVAGATLIGDLHESATPRGIAFVVSHGWGSQRPQDIPDALARAGFTTLAYDLRGHGESTADLTKVLAKDWVADLVAAIDHLAASTGDEIALVGASLGAYLSVLATAQRPIKALALRVPTNLPDGILDIAVADVADSDAFRNRKQGPAGPGDTRALSAIHEFAGPIQIVDADLDAIIPAQTIANYVNAVADPAQLTRHTLRNAPHHLATPELRAEYLEQLIGWASRELAAT
jgi:pimeloyl-ACP methyl ester carboxylesterase